MRWSHINLALSSALAGMLTLAHSPMLQAQDLKSAAMSVVTNSEAMQLQRAVNQSLFIRIGDELIDLLEIREFYKLRNFNPIWTTRGQRNELSQALQTYIESVGRHALNPNDYILPLGRNSLETEILTTERMLRLAQQLSNGRFDPDQIDFDIKFKRKNLTVVDNLALSNALNQDGRSLMTALENLAPQMPAYKDLMLSLAELRDRKARDLTYTRMKYPGIEIRPPYTFLLLPQLRQALNDRGYTVATDSTKYDSNLEMVIKTFQAENGLEVGSNIGPNSEFWRVLSFSIDQRIKQIEVNMEKLRWLPRNLEARHIFVNTAFTEFHLLENGKPVLEMKTVNGRPTWRTPTMRDLLVGVILNPTWTAPDSIVTQMKLPEILKDVTWLEKNRITMKEKSSGAEIDPTSVNWKLEGVNIAKRALFVQQPGPNNSLGIVKFPLAINRDDIYMHDTNERDLFSKGMRQRSSGCMRLEKPIELANYLLQGTEYTPEKLDQLITKGTPDEIYETNQRINLTKDKWVPVYTVYLTAERSAAGRIRFATDYYGQDSRVSAAILQSPAKREGSFR